MSKGIRRMCVLAGLTMVAAISSAALVPPDAQIQIDRALNSPTLTVRYSGANAALVELRINGESIGTRTVTASKSSGETNFTIDLNQLKDGDNEVEIRLFDRAGKLVGSDKTNISTDQSNRGPVFLKSPKVGQTVQGPVEISLGFGREMKNIYVSFFVNNDFKKMTNYPPYNFVWDTTQETNGWHEIEAWVIDESSTTFKTRKTRVFVNNPGGRTDRPGSSLEIAPRTNPIRGTLAGGEAGLKNVNLKGGVKAAGAKSDGAAPTVSNLTRKATVGAATDVKPLPKATVLATGPKTIAPSTKVAKAEPKVAKASPEKAAGSIDIKVRGAVASNQGIKSVPVSAIHDVAAASSLVRITKGQRIPNLGTFAVVLNSQFVNFDVNPRVEEGIPMTPFRHLLEQAGGKVDWENLTKTVNANAEGRNILLQIGDSKAKIDELTVTLERAPYLERGRTIVPMSFIRDVLNVEIEFDKETGHVLITTVKK